MITGDRQAAVDPGLVLWPLRQSANSDPFAVRVDAHYAVVWAILHARLQYHQWHSRDGGRCRRWHSLHSAVLEHAFLDHNDGTGN